MGETPFHEQNTNASIGILLISRCYVSRPQNYDLKQNKCPLKIIKGFFLRIFLFHKLTVQF